MGGYTTNSKKNINKKNNENEKRTEADERIGLRPAAEPTSNGVMACCWFLRLRVLGLSYL